MLFVHLFLFLIASFLPLIIVFICLQDVIIEETSCAEEIQVN